MDKVVPEALIDHILPFNWDVQKVWALEAQVYQVPCTDFVYLLKLPLWSSVKNQGLLFDLCPLDVIRNASSSSYQSQRLNEVKLEYPVDVLIFQNKRWVLDGVHRIAKHFMLNSSTLPARFHDETIIPVIKVN